MGGASVTRRGVLLGGIALAASLGPFAGEAAAAAAPAIVDCAGWGARPNSAIVPIWNRRPVKILVHHTATPNQKSVSRDTAYALARGIQNYHMDVRGWLDTGQHFTISRGGYVMEGRHRSLEIARAGRQQVEGAHCTGQNIVSLGIENEGTYTDATPPDALWNQLRVLCAWLCGQYGIAPTELYGHRDFKNTECPGDRLYAMLPQLRSEVAGLLGRRIEGGADALVKATWPLLRRGDTGPEVTAAQYLLRDAGAGVGVPTGVFDAATDAAVRRFQAATRAEEVNGLLGGESWPELARPVQRGDGSDAARAVEILVARQPADRVPDRIDRPVWQRLLGTGGAPASPDADPPGAPTSDRSVE